MILVKVGVRLMKTENNNVYLALYKGKAKKLSHRICDSVTKFFTRGKYSHCEIAIANEDSFTCYSSSIRDGGVRKKEMQLDVQHWDFIHLPNLSAERLESFYRQTKGLDYDLLGALGCVVGLRQHQQKYFCSEWCFNAIFGSTQGFRFSPVMLAEVVKAHKRA